MGIFFGCIPIPLEKYQWLIPILYWINLILLFKCWYIWKEDFGCKTMDWDTRYTYDYSTIWIYKDYRSTHVGISNR